MSKPTKPQRARYYRTHRGGCVELVGEARHIESRHMLVLLKVVEAHSLCGSLGDMLTIDSEKFDAAVAACGYVACHAPTSVLGYVESVRSGRLTFAEMLEQCRDPFAREEVVRRLGPEGSE